MEYWWALFAMVCWGLAPIFAKFGLVNMDPMVGLLLRTVAAAGLISTWTGLSGTAAQIHTVSIRSMGLILVEAILATLIGDLAYYKAIKGGDVSVVTLIMSSSPLITMMCAALFLDEPMSGWRILGALYIIVGIVMVR
ncbi:MAG: EamA family transporter [Chitinophagales bacterium]